MPLLNTENPSVMFSDRDNTSYLERIGPRVRQGNRKKGKKSNSLWRGRISREKEKQDDNPLTAPRVTV